MRSGPTRRRPWSVILIGVALAPALSAPVAAQPPSTIPWRTNLDQALAEARATQRPLWLQFTGPWCPACQRMDREVFLDPLVVNAAGREWIPVKLKADQHPSLDEAYGLTSLPATVILRPTGEFMTKREGFSPPEEFAGFLNGLAVVLQPTRPPVARRDEDLTTSTTSTSRPLPLGVSGYCPVSLVDDQRLVVGSSRLTVRYDGQEFRFASEASRAAFQADPDRYAPIAQGMCPVMRREVGRGVPGNPRVAAVYRDQLFVFVDRPARARFLADPDRYSRKDVEPFATRDRSTPR